MEDIQCLKMNEVKRLAMEYYADEGPGACVVERMEVLINNIFIDNPDDVYGHIVSQDDCIQAVVVVITVVVIVIYKMNIYKCYDY